MSSFGSSALEYVQLAIHVNDSEACFCTANESLILDPAIEVKVGNTSLGVCRMTETSMTKEIHWNRKFYASVLLKDVSKSKISCYLLSGVNRIGLIEISLIDISIMGLYQREFQESFELSRRYSIKSISDNVHLALEGTMDISCTFVPRIEGGIRIGEEKNNLQLNLIDFEIIQQQLNRMIPFSSVETTIYWLAATANKTLLRGFFSNKVLLQDLLMDVAFITSSSKSAFAAKELEIIIENKTKRNKLVLINATKIDLSSGKVERHAPIETNCIQLNKSENCLRFFLLKLSNRYSLWVWVKWLRFLFLVWSNQQDLSSPPDWVSSSNGTYSSQITIISSDDQRFSGRGLIAIDKPYQIQCDDKVIRIHSVTSMIISIDSVVPRSHSLQLNILSCFVKVDSDDEEGSAISSGKDSSDKRRGSMMKMLGGMYRKKSVSESSLASSNGSNKGGDGMKSFIAINFDNMNLRTQKVSCNSLLWNQSISIDVDVDVVEKNCICSDVYSGLDLFLFSGKDEKEELVKQKHLLVNGIISKFDGEGLQLSNEESEVKADLILDSSIGSK